MPFESVIYPDRRLIVSTGTGIVTGDDGLACCVGLKTKPQFNPSFNQLIDLSPATKFTATPEQIRRIAQEPLLASSSRRAIVAAESAVFGLARMFEAYRSLSEAGEHVRVFREIDSALDWLSETSDETARGAASPA